MRNALLVFLLLTLSLHHCSGMLARYTFPRRPPSNLRIKRLLCNQRFSPSFINDLIKRDPSAAILISPSPQQWLKGEQEELNAEFAKLGFCIQRKKIRSLIAEYLAWEHKHCQTLHPITNPYIRTRLEKVNNDFQFNMKLLGIFNNSNGSHSATQHALELNLVNLSDHSDEAIDYILAHERHHQYHGDPIIWNIMKTMYDHQNKAESRTLLRLNRYHEMAADVATLLKGKEYAHGLIEVTKIEQFKSHYRRHFQTVAQTHPLDETRLALASLFLEMSD